jgi:hypothetical protein
MPGRQMHGEKITDGQMNGRANERKDKCMDAKCKNDKSTMTIYQNTKRKKNKNKEHFRL